MLSDDVIRIREFWQNTTRTSCKTALNNDVNEAHKKYVSHSLLSKYHDLVATVLRPLRVIKEHTHDKIKSICSIHCCFSDNVFCSADHVIRAFFLLSRTPLGQSKRKSLTTHCFVSRLGSVFVYPYTRNSHCIFFVKDSLVMSGALFGLFVSTLVYRYTGTEPPSFSSRPETKYPLLTGALTSHHDLTFSFNSRRFHRFYEPPS